MTTDREPTSHSSDIERLQRDVARLEAEIRSIESRHRIAIERLASSTRYRIGSTIVELRHAAGWRRLPHTVRDIWSLQRRRRRENSQVASRVLSPRSPIVADVVLDEFSQRAFEHELTVRPIGPRVAPSADAALFLAESAWIGPGGRWRHQFSHFGVGNDLDDTIGRARALGVPTVFWNKEDPAHFETFLAVAGRFDHVFTTDSNCVERYRAMLGHERVATLPFAAQPALHNPIGRATGGRSICFAGAWRGDVHPQRVEQLTTLLDAAREVGDLQIYARHPAHGRADFPDRYRACIVGEVPYETMLAEYRRHACFLNVNTVTDSPTMLSRRVFEILACRTPVVSSPSPAIERTFGGVVPTPSNASETLAVLTELVTDPDRRDRLGQLGFRAVMSAHTYQHRVRSMLDIVGIDGFPSPTLPSADGVVEIMTLADLPRALASVEPLRRCLGSFVVVCREEDSSELRVESRGVDHVVHAGRSIPNSEVLKGLPGVGEFVAFLDVGARYGSAMVTDALLATRFATADVYGKTSSHAAVTDGVRPIGDGREFCEADDVIDGTAIVRRSTITRPSSSSDGEGSLSRAAATSSVRRFAVDRFNHVAAQHSGQPTGTVRRLDDIIF